MANDSLSVPYLVLSGTLFLVLIVAFVFGKPLWSEWRTTEAQTATLEKQLSERQTFLMTIDQKSAALQANAAYDQELGVMLPTDESFEDVLRSIDRYVAVAGVQVSSVDNVTASVQTATRVAEALGNETANPADLTIHNAAIKLQGSYQQVRQFISSIENAARFTDILSLSIARNNTQPDLLEGSLNTQFYSLGSLK